MSAYVIVDIEIHDAAGYDEYRKVVGATLSAYGGKFVVRGGKIDVLEGSWKPKRIVVLEFDSAARAREWYIPGAEADAHAGIDGQSYRGRWNLRARVNTVNGTFTIFTGPRRSLFFHLVATMVPFMSSCPPPQKLSHRKA